MNEAIFKSLQFHRYLGATLDECVVNFIHTIKTIINGRLFPPRTYLLTFKILKISDGFDNAFVAFSCWPLPIMCVASIQSAVDCTCRKG